MIRPITPEDTDTLTSLANGTGVFKPHEIVALREVLDDYHAMNQADGHRAHLMLDEQSRVLGFVYFAPIAMTDNTWDIWWIAVDKQLQGRGVGRQLLTCVEDEVRSQKGRLLLIETSSLPNYEPTRQFYLKHGYVACATIPDFYTTGDAKVIFWKRLGIHEAQR
jgi:ribosomal protein S18 acetylase RimI-like enzyme